MPVIHLLNIKTLASRYGLPLLPSVEESTGVGDVFYATTIHRAPLLLILFVLAGLLALCLPPRSRRDSMGCR
jgi:hypothetical protein